MAVGGGAPQANFEATASSRLLAARHYRIAAAAAHAASALEDRKNEGRRTHAAGSRCAHISFYVTFSPITHPPKPDHLKCIYS